MTENERNSTFRSVRLASLRKCFETPDGGGRARGASVRGGGRASEDDDGALEGGARWNGVGVER